MIATIVTEAERRAELQFRCLARRGMLHAECDAFDYLRLAPHAEFVLRSIAGTESAWLVVAGAGELATLDGTPEPRRLAAHDLALVRDTSGARVCAGAEGIELLIVTVLERAVSDALPARRPVV